MKALVIGKQFFHLMPIPALLSRAGFTVDVVSTSPSMVGVHYIATNIKANDDDDLVRLANTMNKTDYTLTVISDDLTLNIIAKSNLSTEEKAALLPIVNSKNINHIGSKIALSIVLKKSGIKTPDFAVVSMPANLKKEVKKIGFPILIKIDFSGGGEGIFECQTEVDLETLEDQSLNYPLLVQKKIDGRLLDLSGFFQHGKPIYFNQSEALAFSDGRFSSSKLRKYKTRTDPEILDELNQLGKALGMHGFSNITCIESKHDKQRYFIEADMRPNVWLEYGKYYGDDPAPRIKNYFINGSASFRMISHCQDEFMTLPYMPRMRLFEIMINRYQCRKYFDDYTDYNLQKWLIKNKTKRYIVSLIKPRVSPFFWSRLKNIANGLT